MAYQVVDFRMRETGAQCRMEVSELYRFRSGKIIEWRAMYFDVAKVAKVMTGQDKV